MTPSGLVESIFKMEAAGSSETLVPVTLYTAISHKILILWHVDPLQGHDHETKNDTTAIARLQLCKYASVLEPLLGSCLGATMEVLLEAVFSVDPLRGSIARPSEFISVSAVQWSIVESNWESTVVGQSQAGKNVSTEAEDIVGSLYQTTGEHTANWEDLSVCRVCELAIALESLVVRICKCSINQITNPDPVCSHTQRRDNINWLGSSGELIVCCKYIMTGVTCEWVSESDLIGGVHWSTSPEEQASWRGWKHWACAVLSVQWSELCAGPGEAS
jgi:hypothetical protein